MAALEDEGLHQEPVLAMLEKAKVTDLAQLAHIAEEEFMEVRPGIAPIPIMQSIYLFTCRYLAKYLPVHWSLLGGPTQSVELAYVSRLAANSFTPGA